VSHDLGHRAQKLPHQGESRRSAGRCLHRGLGYHFNASAFRCVSPGAHGKMSLGEARQADRWSGFASANFFRLFFQPLTS
jgi:hypothetical protein